VSTIARPALLALFALACGGKSRDENKESKDAKDAKDPKSEVATRKADARADANADPKELAKTEVLPAECADYRAAAEKAAGCDKLGSRRAELRADLDRSWAAWSKLDDAGRKVLTKSCADLAATVRAVTAAACP
jgi:hypothetical protein